MSQVLNQLQLKGHYNNSIVILAFFNQIESQSTLAGSLSPFLREVTSMNFGKLDEFINKLSFVFSNFFFYYSITKVQNCKMKLFFFASVDIKNLLM